MPIDSIAVSGHKFLGCPMPCGITLTRKEHIAKMSQEIEYLNSVDTTIMVSSCQPASAAAAAATRGAPIVRIVWICAWR